MINKELFQKIINRQATIQKDYRKATPKDIKALYELALEYGGMVEYNNAIRLLDTAKALALSNASDFEDKKELVMQINEAKRRIEETINLKHNNKMENKESIMKELETKTSRENLSGNAHEDAVIFFNAALEYAEIEEFEKARRMANKAYTALLAARTRNSSTPVVSEIMERTAVELRCAEYDLLCTDASDALGKLQHCMELIEKYATEFSSTEVTDSPFYKVPRQISIDALEVNDKLYEDIASRRRAFAKFCKENNLCD